MSLLKFVKETQHQHSVRYNANAFKLFCSFIDLSKCTISCMFSLGLNDLYTVCNHLKNLKYD